MSRIFCLLDTFWSAYTYFIHECFFRSPNAYWKHVWLTFALGFQKGIIFTQKCLTFRGKLCWIKIFQADNPENPKTYLTSHGTRIILDTGLRSGNERVLFQVEIRRKDKDLSKCAVNITTMIRLSFYSMVPLILSVTCLVS